MRRIRFHDFSGMVGDSESRRRRYDLAGSDEKKLV